MMLILSVVLAGCNKNLGKLYTLVEAYDLNLRTTSRVDICQELYDEITNELEKDGYQEIMMNQNELTSLNPLITPS